MRSSCHYLNPTKNTRCVTKFIVLIMYKIICISLYYIQCKQLFDFFSTLLTLKFMFPNLCMMMFWNLLRIMHNNILNNEKMNDYFFQKMSIIEWRNYFTTIILLFLLIFWWMELILTFLLLLFLFNLKNYSRWQIHAWKF